MPFLSLSLTPSRILASLPASLLQGCQGPALKAIARGLTLQGGESDLRPPAPPVCGKEESRAWATSQTPALAAVLVKPEPRLKDWTSP